MALINEYFSVIFDYTNASKEEEEANSKKPPTKSSNQPFFPNVETVLEAYDLKAPSNGIELNPSGISSITDGGIETNYKNFEIGVPIEVKKHGWHAVLCRLDEKLFMYAPIDDNKQK